MRIILEPTQHEDQHSVTIESPSDELEMGAAVELIRCALLAWGYHPTTVDEWMGEG